MRVGVLLVVVGVVGCNDEPPRETCTPDPFSFWVSVRELDGGVRAAFENSNEIDISRSNTRVLRGAACAPVCLGASDTRIKCTADLAAPIAPENDGGRSRYGITCSLDCG